MMGRELPEEVELSRAIWNHERSMDEDCLVLNVWTPALDGPPRPVLVWLHGGGLSVGSASWPLYDFSNLAARNDVVVLSINHRVGLLGFMDLSQLDAGLADSGNVGMLDVVAALAWVRDNITAFGGHPGNVTVFGESGGGSKVTCLLGMPSARGLFQHAVAMSGAMLRARTPETSREVTSQALDHVEVSDLAELQSLSWAELVGAESAVFRANGGPRPGHRGFGPTLGPSLPEHPIDAVRSGSAEDIDVVLGCTTHEGLLMMADPAVFFGGDDAVRDHIERLLGDDADQLLAAYQAARPDDSLLGHLLLMASDQLMRIPHIRFAEALVASGSPTWMYLYDFRQPLVPGLEPLAGHGADMPYAFDNVDLAPSAQVEGAHAVAAAMSGALVAHARTGDPNHAALPSWPRYDSTDRSTMVFDAESHLEHDPLGDQRRAWDQVDEGAGLG
jgi:para-nitrobenzyl esterase